MKDKKDSSKIKGKICALVVLGLFAVIALSTSVIADLDNNIWYRDDTNSDVTLSSSASGYNVGIGVTNPTEKLEVDGNIKLSGSADRTIYLDEPSAPSDGNDLTVRAAHGNMMTVGQDGGVLMLSGGDGEEGSSVGNGGDVYVMGGAGDGIGSVDGDVILAGHLIYFFFFSNPKTSCSLHSSLKSPTYYHGMRELMATIC